MNEQVKAFLDSMIPWAANLGIKLTVSLFLLFFSFRVINWLGRKLTRGGERRHADKTILHTLIYALKVTLKGLVVVCLIGYLGIDTGGITALLASLGVGVGLAVNGALSNLAGGVLLVLTRPFRVDDFIEAQGVLGTVSDIRITHTKLVTPDNKVVYLPNGALSSGNITNYSEKDTRRVDFTFSIGYAQDVARAKSLVTEILSSHALVLTDPAPFVRVSAHGTAATELTARAWVKSGDYWTMHFDVMEAVKASFDQNSIEIPVKRLDVRVKAQ